MKQQRNTITDIGILALVTILAYLPVSLGLLSLKNDSLVQYLPFRYHLSESIQHGYFPFWSPYLYTGFPIHADMQGMTWNPLVLLLSSLTRYNMTVLEIEVTLYLLLAAIGMYFLLRSFSFNRWICLLGAISYMSCGYINGSASVIPWISSAAFVPFVLLGLKLLLQKQGMKQALGFCASLCLLFLCGYPTFFIYTSYIIIAVLLYAFIIHYRKKEKTSLARPALLLAGAGVLFLLVCSPAIISYWEFLPYYSRGSGITAERAAQNPFTPFSSLSYLLPGAVHKDHSWLQTDTSMRNGYTGLFVFLLFLLSFRFRMERLQQLLLGITLFSFLLSLGPATPLHRLCYAILPGFDTFRHPANIRLFTTIGIILLAAFGAARLFQGKKEEWRRVIKPLLYLVSGILAAGALYLLLQSSTRENLSASLPLIRSPKALLDAFSFNGFTVIQCVLQLCFLLAMLLVLRKKTIPVKLTAGLIAFNSVLFCWQALPFNFVSQISTAEINNYVRSFPDGYPLPDLSAPVQTGAYSDSSKIPVQGYPNFYNKEISLQDHVITPTLNKDYEKFCSDTSLRKALDGYPFAYLAAVVTTTLPDSLPAGSRFAILTDSTSKPFTANLDGRETIRLEKFGPNAFRFRVSTSSAALLTLFQQYNHNWKIKINNTKASPLKLNRAFMGVTVPAGESLVEWSYEPLRIKTAIWVSLAGIVLLILLLIFTPSKSPHLAN